MKKILLCYLFVTILSSYSFANSFFATEAIQSHYINSFVLRPELKEFVSLSKKKVFEEGDLFIKNLRKNSKLYNDIQNYEHLSVDQQITILYKVFEIEVKTLGIISPKLVIDKDFGRAAYFEFDLDDATNGIVFINPLKTFSENPMISLSLLIHETRHAAQLSQAKNLDHTLEGFHYQEAFMAQKALKGKLGFSDFLTLNNEYDAFLFANYIMYKLFDGKHEMIDMGTYASQFDQKGDLKIDLEYLHSHSENIIGDFNQLMKLQKEALGI